MKKIILLIALVVSPLVSYGQSMFDTLENMDGVDAIIVNKDMFEILSKFKVDDKEGSEAMEIFSMIKDLNELKVFSTDDKSIATKMDAMVSKAVKSSKLTELMRMKEGNSRIKIYVKSSSNKDFVSEVLMFVKGIDKKTNGVSESVIVSLTGNIDINKLSKIADTFTKDAKIKVSKD
ncbi:DUF4252 domain-containing protein [Flavobacteriaceae bacterium S356]|uniref:DUF4252 domain-containing protein n=1 Tax=Asprobacillus argus TaxID=3076534 RepID=A0ABU3LE00_9FLAO|nr:DUF4252 domain-containing protein [Flavobacteriaceae bacterium S356]